MTAAGLGIRTLASKTLAITIVSGCPIKAILGSFLDPDWNTNSPLISLPTCSESGKRVATLQLRKLRLTKVLGLLGSSVELEF